jgi:hypothetical protein
VHRDAEPVNARRPASDPARAQLSLVHALRLVREVDRQLEHFEFEPGLVESLAGGWITMGEFRDAVNLPFTTGAESVLRDGLGLFPPLQDDDLELATERVNENGWTRLTMVHRPTGLSVRSTASERGLALEIAEFYVARVVWSEVIKRAESRLQSASGPGRWLDRLVVGVVDLQQVRTWLDSRRAAGDSYESVARVLGVDVPSAEKLDGEEAGLIALIEEYRAGLLDALPAEAPRPRCPTCGFEFSNGPDTEIRRCPGILIVYEETIRRQGTEPLDCTVPVVGHPYPCNEVIKPA